ncbi:MAG: aspartate--tRNA(Asn) ligase [Nanoarchaeota archaeon]|nr:aspartate--tRNA(Asn) ligase [Nanoarchaeota archaeon]
MRLAGFVSELRDFGKLRFIILRNSEGFYQITLKKEEVSKEVFNKFDELTKESVIIAEGRKRKSEKARNGWELIPSEIVLLSKAEQPVPLDISGKIESGLDARLDWRSIDLRTLRNQAIFRIEASLVRHMREFLDDHGFLEVFTPCIMGTPSEGGAEVFPLLYFDKQAFLRQDPQLHRQLTILGGFEKIYDLGPNWRAEPSHTTRHVTEYHSCAVEMAYIENEYDVMKVEEELVRYAISKLGKEMKEDLKLLGVKAKKPGKFPILEFPEVYNILEKLGKKFEFGEDYDRESEVLLWKHVKEKYGSDFFFVNKFPFAVKPFYVMKDDETYARSVDLLYKGLELSSGGQREHRYEELMRNVKDKGLDPKGVEWFTKFFKYGAPPHGGFALGIERLVMQLLGLQNIREACLFPRDVERVTP